MSRILVDLLFSCLFWYSCAFDVTPYYSHNFSLYLSRSLLSSVIYITYFFYFENTKTRFSFLSNSVTFSPDGNSLYAGDSLGIIYTFNTAITANGVDDIAKKTVTKETEITNCAITHLSMERSNYLLAVQTKDSLIRVFETKVMVPSQRYSGITCTDTMMQSTLSPDCEYLVAGSQDGTAKVWAVRKAEIIPTPEWSFKFDGALNAVAWNRVENMIAFSSYAAKMPIIVFKDPTPIANSDDDDLIQF